MEEGKTIVGRGFVIFTNTCSDGAHVFLLSLLILCSFPIFTSGIVIIMHSSCTVFVLYNILAPALEVSVESSTSTGPSDTVVLCTANDTEMIEWSVSGVSQDFHLDIDSGTVLNTSADNVVTLHQGLSLRSVVTSAGISGLNNVESTMIFDSMFPYTGQFSITCTGRTVFNTLSVYTNVFLEGMNPTMSEPTDIAI